ncbi:ABC transporter ATP-binding protein [uncultured Secundilactobacillus sp.]|uniref:ABC transporter ATP-binding protein n=1 Tax=uncultured Secundilactobacillus sp. TaxID=2813935 RepID=UPI002586803D|nr:ABC transporter ATP-binding protein [uncultured Secundilactobacillus sp.]
MTTDVLTIDHLTKRFGHTQALSDVTLTVHQGEVFGFIGPNGAGKSTTIRILLGILKKTSGSVSLLGLDPFTDNVAIHQRLAYVPGDVALWPNLSGGEIIDFLLHLNGHAHTARTDALIETFQLDPTKKARTYSKGNRQKVALIAAFSQEADFYIFDEPTSGLDPLNEQRFQELVLELKQAGKSVLLSSHILSEVEKMCDRIGIIRQGKLIETGTLAEMRHLTRTQMVVKTLHPLDILEERDGLYDLQLDAPKTTASFSVDSDQIPVLMDRLAAADIVSIQSNPPTLEDLFLRYYGDDDAAPEKG